MPHIIHSVITAGITELKTNPMATVNAGKGYPVAILNRNQPTFYCVPADLYEQILECIGDKELANLVKLRSEQTLHDVSLDSPL